MRKGATKRRDGNYSCPCGADHAGDGQITVGRTVIFCHSTHPTCLLSKDRHPRGLDRWGLEVAREYGGSQCAALLAHGWQPPESEPAPNGTFITPAQCEALHGADELNELDQAAEAPHHAEFAAPFDINANIAHTFLTAPPNHNGRPNTDVVRPVASAIDLVRGSRQTWTIDFGLMSEEEAAQYELPFAYVSQHIYPIRSQNRRAAYAEKW